MSVEEYQQTFARPSQGITYGSPTTGPDGRPLSIAERVASARRRRMVGRETIIDEFRAAISQSPFPYCVLQVHGPGGVGKTTLLDALAQQVKKTDIPLISVDARAIEATPAGFLRLVGQSLGMDEPFDSLDVQTRLYAMDKFVLMIDTYEAVGPLDGWLRNDFLPQLPGSALVVMAGRKSPSPAWRSDPGWQELVRTISLRNFSPSESRDFLTRQNVPDLQHDSVVNFTHGYPLALSLIADLYKQRGELEVNSDSYADVIPLLMERLLDEAPTTPQKLALQICALVRWTSEPLLGHFLGEKDAASAFDWLRGLSFIEAGSGGLMPHDIAREALMAELKWRNPDRNVNLHRRASEYYSKRVTATRGDEQERTLLDFVYLHRDNAIVASAFEWPDNTPVYCEPICRADHDAIVELVEKYEGPEAAEFARYWTKHPASGGQVYRSFGPGTKQILGFALSISIEKLEPGEGESNRVWHP